MEELSGVFCCCCCVYLLSTFFSDFHKHEFVFHLMVSVFYFYDSAEDRKRHVGGDLINIYGHTHLQRHVLGECFLSFVKKKS